MIERLLDKGGQAAVYLATDRMRGQPVAIKVGFTDYVRDEGWYLARIAHPAVPRIYDLFEEQRRFHLVMDFIDGVTLHDELHRRGAFALSEVLDLAVVLSEVLEALHTSSIPIILGDLTPYNVLVDRANCVHVVDFGIAQSELLTPSRSLWPLQGTTGFLAPERYNGAPASRRADIYSLGATLHCLLTGETPEGPATRFYFCQLRGVLGALIMRMVNPHPGRRPGSATRLKWAFKGLRLSYWQAQRARGLARWLSYHLVHAACS
ncbi:MAG: serine/threonine protein kinase [Streptosporangiaceae bacterium]